MKYTILIVIWLMLTFFMPAQNSMFVRGKSYEGYIFSKEYAIWGFPPEQNRYTPNKENIAQAEKILQDSIETDYVRLNQTQWRKPLINKRTLKKYARQYVGYLSENNEIIVCIYLNKEIDRNKLSKDIISVFDGGSNHWRIYINIATKELSNMQINGMS